MNTNLLKFFLLACIFAVHTAGYSQNFSGHNWYFGTGTQGLRFSRSSGNAASIATHSPLAGPGGAAVVSSSVNGDILFYTDGVNVYDASNAVMPSGTGLTADATENQPVAVAKVPGSQTLYYIIIRTATGDIASATVDMSLTGNAPPGSPSLGDVSVSSSPIAGLTVRSGAMITVPHSNGTDFWLITHAQGSPDYAVTPFTAGGPGTTVSYPGIGIINNADNFAYHAATGKIAVIPAEVNRNAEIIDFDNATGAITFDQAVPNSGSANRLYDTEWSNSGQYLYLSGGTDIKQFDLTNPTASLLSILPQPAGILGSYGIQMAPDSAIYHLYEATAGQFRLGKLTNTDTVATEVTYTAQAFPGNIDFNAQQFPAFTPAATPNITLSFTVDGLCANAPSSFFPTVTPAADSLVWDFADGSTSSDWSPVHTYTAGQGYNVSLTAYLNGQSKTVSQLVTIAAFDTQITLVQDTTACSCELPFPKATGTITPCNRTFEVTAQIQGSGGATWQWYGPAGAMTSGSGTSATLKPDSAGYYYLVATVGGCSTYAGVNIKEYGVQDQRANIWFFGDHAGLDFNPLPDNPVAPISNGVMNAPEGTATISDRNGQVIFFTDGNTVWNRAEDVVAENISGNTAAADASTQAALIIPVPGDETLYYIFTTQPVYGPLLNQYELRYAIFDVKLNGGTGGIVDPDDNPTTPPSTVLFTKSTERITGNANWLIAHEYGNNSFRAYRVTQQGLGNPVISGIGSDHSYATAENGRGYMKLNTQNTLAVALSTPGVSNTIEIFDFIDSTGSVTNFRKIDLGEPSGQVYGLEFSSSGQKLYASLIGNSKLFELAYDSATKTYTKRPEIPVVTPPGEIGAIQIGPDGNIYVATNGSGSLGTIQSVDDPKLPSTFNPTGQALESGTTSNLGLPNFIQIIADPSQGPGIVVNGTCLGDSTNFSASGTDPIDQFQWFFGDGQGSTEQEVSHLYAAASTYTVTLIITNRCGLNVTLTQTVVITAPPAAPTFLQPGQFPVVCNGPLTLEATPATNPDLANLTFLWSTGETTRTIVVNSQNPYSVTITNAQGCTSDGSIIIGDNRPIVDLGPNSTICQDETVAALDAQNPGATYAWTINTVASGTARTQTVDTSVPGTFEYEVTVTDPVTTCFVKDSVIYAINELPVFTATGFDPSACGVSDGRIEMTINTPATSTFSYSVAGPSPVTPGTNQAAGVLITAPNLTAGTYSVTVTDQVSSCPAVQAVTLNNTAFTITGVTKVNTCDPLVLRVAHTATVMPITYRLINTATGQVAAQGTGAVGTFDITPGVPSGNYIVEITDGSAPACSFSSPAQQFDQNTPVTVTFDDTNLCTTSTLVAAGAGGTGPYTYDWSASPAGSITAANGANATIATGTWTVQVTVTDAGGTACPGIGTTTITVDPPVTPDFTQTDACQDQVTITATPSGSYLYRWFRNGTLDPGLAGPQITATRTNDNQSYSLTLYNPVNGCQYNSPTKVIEVNGQLSVTLSNTFACEGSPFTITATPGAGQTAASHQWSFNGTLITGQTASTLVVQDGKSGKYTVVISDGATCTATSTIQVLSAPSTAGNLSSLVRICPDPANPDPNTRQAVLNPGTFQSYNWFKDGVAMGETGQTITVVDAGVYSVDLTNNFGCPSDDQAEVVVNCDPVIVGPNAFRPSSSVTVGGDAVNQSFRLFTFFIDDEGFDVFIFNRWGEMVYHSNQRDFRWNGGYNGNAGQLAPPGTYSYVVRYKSSYSPDRGIQEKRGGVVLMR